MTQSMKRIHNAAVEVIPLSEGLITGNMPIVRPAKIGKRIHKVTIKRMVDEDPDTSWWGEYTNRPDTEFSIDRKHDGDCPQFWANGIGDDGEDTDCNCNHHFTSGQFEYFDPGTVETFDVNATWIPSSITCESARRDYWHKTMRDNARKDYGRVESLNRGDWCFIGIKAEAEIQIPRITHLNMTPFERYDSVMQTITSSGLWGIESDSDAAYLKEVEDEQLAELREQLHAIGFSKRATTAAFKNVERKE